MQTTTAQTKNNAGESRDGQVYNRGILERIAGGDDNAVSDCMEAYGGLVRSIARRYLGTGSSEIEDSMQEVFIQVWKNAGRFDPSRGSEATFVATIARRRIIDRIRRLASVRTVGSEALQGQASERHTEDTGPLTRREETEPAMQALRRLSDKEQEAIGLSIGFGYSYERIANVSETPLGTVKSRMVRALRKLEGSMVA